MTDDDLGVPVVRRSDYPESADIRMTRQLERKEMLVLAEELGMPERWLAFLREVVELRSRWDAEGLPWA